MNIAKLFHLNPNTYNSAQQEFKKSSKRVIFLTYSLIDYRYTRVHKQKRIEQYKFYDPPHPAYIAGFYLEANSIKHRYCTQHRVDIKW